MGAEEVMTSTLGSFWLLSDDDDKAIVDVDIQRNPPDGRRFVRYRRHEDEVDISDEVPATDERSDEELARDVLFLRGKVTRTQFRRCTR